MLVRKQMLEPIDFEGLKVFDYTAALEDPASLGSSVAVVDVPSGAVHPDAHSRRSDKYYLVSSGELDFVLDGESQVLKAGDFCFVRQGRRFSYANTSTKRAALVLVHTPSFDLRDEVFVGR